MQTQLCMASALGQVDGGGQIPLPTAITVIYTLMAVAILERTSSTY